MQYIQQLLSRINLLYLCPFVQKILHLSLILCLVALTPMSAYAAGDSLTSSISLSFNSTKKFQLEAYEHFYIRYGSSVTTILDLPLGSAPIISRVAIVCKAILVVYLLRSDC